MCRSISGEVVLLVEPDGVLVRLAEVVGDAEPGRAGFVDPLDSGLVRAAEREADVDTTPLGADPVAALDVLLGVLPGELLVGLVAVGNEVALVSAVPALSCGAELPDGVGSGRMKANDTIAVSPPIHSSTRPGRGFQLASQPTASRCARNSRR
jgi:hypothetical protein